MVRFRIHLQFLVTLFVMLCTALSTGADVVVVKPSGLSGWVADAYQGKDPAATPPMWSFSNNTPPPFLDAFYMSVGWSCNRNPALPPPWNTNEEATNEVWFGTNQFNGVRIADITRLEYSTFTHFSGNLWESHVSNPIKLVLTIKTDGVPDNYPPQERQADGPRNWRVLIFSPWDPKLGPGLKTWDRTNYGCWQTWDVLSSVLYVGNEPNDNLLWQSWYEIVANYPNATLEYPYTYAENLSATGGMYFDPWKAPYPDESRYPVATLTGTSLSFQAGCRRPFDVDWGGTWWKEHIGLRGYVDMLTVGVNGIDTTFDFKADEPPARFVGMTNKAAVDTIMKRADDVFHVVLFGQVVEDPYWNYSPEFFIDDGSGVRIKVKAPNNTVYGGCYVRVAGTLVCDEVEAVDSNNPPTTRVQPTLFTDADNVIVIRPGPM